MTECLVYENVYATIGGDTGPDWSGGARSSVVYYADCFFGFTVPPAVQGVVVGLNDNDIDTTWHEIEHGFRFKDGLYKFVELGALVSPGTPWDTYSEGDRFYIVRIGQDVIYCLRPSTAFNAQYWVHPSYPKNIFPGQVLRISPVPSVGTVFLDSALWAEFDSVDNERSGVLWKSYDNEIVGLGDEETPKAATLFFGLPLTAKGIDSFAATDGSMALELPLDVTGTVTFDEGANLEVPIEVLGADFPLNNYMIGELPLFESQGGEFMPGDKVEGINGMLLLSATGTSFADAPSMTLELPAPEIIMGTSFFVDGDSGIQAVLPAPVISMIGGDGGATGFKYSALEIQLPAPIVTGIGAGEGFILELPIPNIDMIGSSNIGNYNTVLDAEMPLPELFMTGTAEVENRFLILLQFTGEIEPVIEIGEADVLETFYVTATALPILISRLTESVQVSSPVQTFYQIAVELVDAAQALAEEETDILLTIAETFNITSSLSVTQVVALAEALTAAGAVQSTYTGVVAILAAMTASDNDITGGGGPAGVQVQDFGPPSVEFTFTGYWLAGTEIQLSYTTDAGPGYISYIVETNSEATTVMTLFTAALDAQPLVAATFDGTSVTMTAQAPATTVQI